MPTKVTMPKLGESVAEGTVGRWHKQVGDTIELDEPLVEIVSDKITNELPSPIAGRLIKISVEQDQTVKVGTEIAQIEETTTAQAATPFEASTPVVAPLA